MSVIQYRHPPLHCCCVNHTGAQLAASLTAAPATRLPPAETPSSAVPPTESAAPCRRPGILELTMPRSIHVFRTRPIRRRDRRRARKPDVLPAGRPRQAGHLGDAGKQRVAVLAERIGALLTGCTAGSAHRCRRRMGSPIWAADHPLDAEFRVGTMGLGWDAEAQSVVVELLAVSDTEFDIGDPRRRRGGPDAVRVFPVPGIGWGSPPAPIASSPPGAAVPALR